MALHSSPVGQTSIRDDEEGVVTVWKIPIILILKKVWFVYLGLRISFSVIHGIAFVAWRSNKNQKWWGRSWAVTVYKNSHHKVENSLICLFVYCHMSLGLRISSSVIHGIAFVACRSNKYQKWHSVEKWLKYFPSWLFLKSSVNMFIYECWCWSTIYPTFLKKSFLEILFTCC